MKVSLLRDKIKYFLNREIQILLRVLLWSKLQILVLIEHNRKTKICLIMNLGHPQDIIKVLKFYKNNLLSEI